MGKETEPKVFTLAQQLAKKVDAPAAPIMAPDDDDQGGENSGTFDAVIDDSEPTPQADQPGEGSYQQLHEQQQYQYPPGDVPPMLSPDDLAIIGVNVLDGVQQGGFAWLAHMFNFTADQRELLETLDKAANRAYEAGSKEAIAMAKWKKYVEYVQGLPFNEGEKERLTTAAKIYMRTTNFTATPFGGLMAAMSEVFIGRGMGIFINKFHG